MEHNNRKVFFYKLVDPKFASSSKISNKQMRSIFISIVSFLSALSLSGQSQEVLLTVGEEKVHLQDFKYLYEKNYQNAKDIYSKESLDEYLDLFIKFKLKVTEAYNLGYHERDAFKAEYGTYKKQLAKSYLKDKQQVKKLIKEAYERLKYEVLASHLLVKLPEIPSLEDTIKAYNKILGYKKRIESGENFEDVALKHSDDPSAKFNKGSLGYFTAMQMVYPFESAAYDTPVGKISDPIRTKFGYHLIKVYEKRPSRGSVRVAHIMIRATEGLPKEDSIKAHNKIKEIHKKIKEGGSWDTLCKQFSEDPNSRDKAGQIQEFTIGQMPATFAEAAFNLQETGQISEPVKTPYGWHLIKLLEKKSIKPFSDMEYELQRKVSRDSRSEVSRQKYIQKIKKENNFKWKKENSKLLPEILNDNSEEKKINKLTYEKELFTINNKGFTINDFLDYFSKKNRAKSNISEQLIQKQLDDYAEESLMQYEEEHLVEKYDDYRYLVQEYEEGILLFNIMEEKVWNKAIEDTSSLKSFFKENPEKYQWGKRVEAQLFNAKSKSIIKEIKKLIKKDSIQVSTTVVTFADTLTLADQESRITKKVDNILKKHLHDNLSSIQVKLSRSKPSVSLSSLYSLKKLVQEKLSTKKNIQYIVDEKINKKGSSTGEDIISEIKVYSPDFKLLEEFYNQKDPLALKVEIGKHEIGEWKYSAQIELKQGTYILREDDRWVLVDVKKVLLASPKQFEEIKGQVITDYQENLENQWIKELKEKYKVQVNKNVYTSLIKN